MARLRPRRLLTLLAAASATLVFSFPALAVPVGWTAPARAFAERFGPQHAMVLDASGHAHIAVEGTTTSGIWYVTDAPSGTWSSTRISSGHDHDPSIAIDAGGQVVVAFDRRDASQSSSLGIWTATLTGSSWSVTRRYHGQAFYPSIQLAGGKVGIAFSGPGAHLLYASNASGSWVTQTVAGSCCGSAPSLSMVGGPNIAWSKATHTEGGALMYSYRSGSHWHVQTIDAKATLDPTLIWSASTDTPLVAYLRPVGGTYVAFDGEGGWQSERFGAGYLDRPDIAASGGHPWLVEGNGHGIRLINADTRTATTLTSATTDFAPEIEFHAGKATVAFDRASGTTADGIWIMQQQ